MWSRSSLSIWRERPWLCRKAHRRRRRQRERFLLVASRRRHRPDERQACASNLLLVAESLSRSQASLMQRLGKHVERSIQFSRRKQAEADTENPGIVAKPIAISNPGVATRQG